LSMFTNRDVSVCQVQCIEAVVTQTTPL